MSRRKSFKIYILHTIRYNEEKKKRKCRGREVVYTWVMRKEYEILTQKVEVGRPCYVYFVYVLVVCLATLAEASHIT